MRTRTILGLSVVAFGGLVAGTHGADPPWVLVTSGGTALVSTQEVLQIPLTMPLPRLQFDFGFATDETPVPNSFLDSFSLTLQNNEPSQTVLLLTVDAFGVKWAPPNPGGLLLLPDSLLRHEIPFPDLVTNLDHHFAYSLTLSLPPELAGKPATLYLDLFNNTNSLGSLAFLDHLTVVPGPVTNATPGFALQSSASVQGPFADESGVETNASTHTLTLPLYGLARFYRLHSDSEAQITRFRIRESDLIMDYEFPAPQVFLQTAASVDGPYLDATNALVNLGNRYITLPEPGATRFYRIRSNIRARIIRQLTTPKQIQLFFTFQPIVFGLQSSAAIQGPYADESSATMDLERQTVTLSRSNSARFFRIRSDIQQSISNIRIVGDRLILTYE